MHIFRFVRSAAVVSLLAAAALASITSAARAQGLGGAGTVQGTVKDPTGSAMPAVVVELSNPVTGLKRSATTDADGKFEFRNLPPNNYHISVAAQGFATYQTDADIRSAVPFQLGITLNVETATQSVKVVGHAEDLVERDPTEHTDVDQSLIAKIPVESSAVGLNQVITMASPGVVADSNGFFHPVGDHAQTQFSIDNQPVTDQQSRIYSNQISPDAVQDMEVITGVAPAEYGDKSSLVVHIVTKSGLDQSKPTGTITGGYGSFNAPTFDANIGVGSHTLGNFISINGTRTDRYLDPPEFAALHDNGSNVSVFDRLDVKTGALGTFHLNVQGARAPREIPNTIDQNDLGQDQHQTIDSFNLAPGYSQVIGTATVFTANAYVRHDHVTYTPSADPFADTPGTVSQNRKLFNVGAKADVAYTKGRNNVKVGGEFNAWRLNEAFTLGLTDPTENSPCLDPSGNPAPDPSLSSPSQCLGPLSANPDFVPGVEPFDLSRGGTLFNYNQAATIKEESAYGEDDLKAGATDFKIGLRFDNYDGLSKRSEIEPRLGVSYSIVKTNTVLRASYGRTLETPYNENLLLSAGYGLNGLLGTASPPQPGVRNEGEFGIQQAFGGLVVADFGYFVKHTKNGYDFNVLFDTPIAFPVSWDHSRLNGFTGRIDVVQHHGLSAFVVMAHTNAVYGPPGTGGVLLEQPSGDFRIDHDQKFNATTNLQYAFSKDIGGWVALSWRYDSGLVAGSVGSIADALALSGDQQAAIGFFCGSTFATAAIPITSCDSGGGATRIRIPAEGTEDDLTNPPRIAPRNLFDLGFGADNLLRSTRKTKLTARVSVINLTNKEALFNFLSTFSGTHFVAPRVVTVQVGVGF